MVAKLTVIFFIILCLLVGVSLILAPWVSVGFGDWGDNYFLNLIVGATGSPVLKETILSGWFRGAVTGLGILNLLLAFWEMAHFKQSVQMLEQQEIKGQK